MQNEYTTAVETLKRRLKTEGLTYLELAKKLSLSESGLKKIFAAKDGSVQRLAQIGAAIGLSLSDLFSEMKEPMSVVSFTENQQNYFLKVPKALFLYWKLVYERESLEKAETFLGLNRRESMSLLRQLDKINLLAILPGDRIKIPPIRQIRWSGDGPLIRKLYQEWSMKLLKRVGTPNPKTGEYFMIRYLQMTSSTYEEFLRAMQSLESEFLRRAIYEMRTRPSPLKHVRWVMASDNASFVED